MALTKVTTSVVAINSLTAANIADNAIDATKIANNQILARHIAAGSISDQLAAAQPTITSLGTLTSLTVDDITLNNSTISDNTLLTISSGDDIVLDATSDIILDADGGDIRLKDAGTAKHTISMQSNGDTYFVNETADTDIYFRGVDGSSTITALTLDMSDAGSAYFNNKVGIGDTSPQALLDVGGGYGGNTTVATFAHATDAYIEIENMTTQNGAGIILTNAGTKKWTIQKDTSAHSLHIQDTSGDVMTFLQGGNVGIGTTSPNTNSILHVSAASSGQTTSSNNTQLTIENSGTSGIQLLAGTSNVGGIWVGDSGGAEDGKIYYSNANREWTIASAGTVAMTIESSNVGIGTASPSAKLDVKDQINVTNAENVSLQGLKATRFGYNASYKVLQIGGAGSSTSNNIAIGVDLSGNSSGSFTGYGEAIYFRNDTRFRTPNDANDGFHEYMTLNDGKVGIGTATPVHPLQVNADNDGIMINNSGQTNGEFAALYFTSHNVAAPYPKMAIASKRTGDYGVGDMYFAVDSNNDAADVNIDTDVKMVIKNDGKVLIGQTTAGTNGVLQVTGGIGLTGTSQIRNSTNADDGSSLKFFGNQFVAGSNSHSYGYSEGGYIASLATAGSAILLDVGNTSVNTGHRFRVVNAGNGIDGSIQYLSGTDTRFYVNSSTGDVIIAGTTVQAQGSCSWDLNVRCPVQDFNLASHIANAEFMTFRNQNTQIGSVTAPSGGSSTAFNTSSDYRLKENVSDMTGATTRLKQLKPKRFNWILDDTNTLEDGFLAHEVQAVVPNAVTGTKDQMEDYVDDEGETQQRVLPQQIDHSKLVPLLVKTIQELEARIATLES